VLKQTECRGLMYVPWSLADGCPRVRLAGANRSVSFEDWHTADWSAHLQCGTGYMQLHDLPYSRENLMRLTLVIYLGRQTLMAGTTTVTVPTVNR
jgi:hypothetical protein